MKRLPYTLFAIISMAFFATGCEKITVNEEDNNDDNKDNEYFNGWADSIVADTTHNGFLTVAEAIEAPLDAKINVKGYILGSTSRNIYNAIMAPPFESRSSLILADKIYKAEDETGEYDTFYEDELLPVCLTDFKDIQNTLNLVDNPELWHRQIYIYGIKRTYLRMPGLGTIMKYELVE